MEGSRVPSWSQNRSKIDSSRYLKQDKILDRFWVGLGSILDRFWRPSWDRKSYMWAPRRILEEVKFVFEALNFNAKNKIRKRMENRIGNADHLWGLAALARPGGGLSYQENMIYLDPLRLYTAHPDHRGSGAGLKGFWPVPPTPKK